MILPQTNKNIKAGLDMPQKEFKFYKLILFLSLVIAVIALISYFVDVLINC